MRDIIDFFLIIYYNIKMMIKLIFILTILLMPVQNLTAGGNTSEKEILNKLHKLDIDIEKIKEGQHAINKRIDDVNRRIDDLQGLIWVVLAGMFVLIGFVLWDRRSALAPAIKKNKELEEKSETLLKILKEYARKEPKLATILKSFNLL